VKIKLSEITSIIEPELNAFDKKFKGALKSDVKILDYVIKYLLRKKGSGFVRQLFFLPQMLSAALMKSHTLRL
jgi:hypothetical protein